MECRAAGLPVSTSSSISSEELLVEEEHTEIDLDVIYDQLEQMKQRAKQLRSLLIKDQPTTAEYAKNLEEIEKNGSKNKEVRAVQLQTAELVSQVSILAKRLKEERMQQNKLKCHLQQNNLKSDKLYSRMKKLQKWPEKLRNQTAMCLERYNDLDIHCISLDSLNLFTNEIFKHFMHATKNKVPLDCYYLDYRNICKRLDSTRFLMNASFLWLLKHSNDLTLALRNHKRLGNLSSSARSMIQTEISHFKSEEESMENSKSSVTYSLEDTIEYIE